MSLYKSHSNENRIKNTQPKKTMPYDGRESPTFGDKDYYVRKIEVTTNKCNKVTPIGCRTQIGGSYVAYGYCAGGNCYGGNGSDRTSQSFGGHPY